LSGSTQRKGSWKVPQCARAFTTAEEVRRPNAEQPALGHYSRDRHLSAVQTRPYVIPIAPPTIHADTPRTLLDSDCRQLLRRPVAT